MEFRKGKLQKGKKYEKDQKKDDCNQKGKYFDRHYKHCDVDGHIDEKH